jgi:hypothetical protein
MTAEESVAIIKWWLLDQAQRDELKQRGRDAGIRWVMTQSVDDVRNMVAFWSEEKFHSLWEIVNVGDHSAPDWCLAYWVCQPRALGTREEAWEFWRSTDVGDDVYNQYYLVGFLNAAQHALDARGE